MNFKDPGLQIYGGDLFHAIQGDATASSVTSPHQYLLAQANANAIANAIATANTPLDLFCFPQSMAVFHNQSGGCLWVITHTDERYVAQADSIHSARDNLWCPTTNSATNVIALVECNSYAQTQLMTQLGSLCITHGIQFA